MGSVSHHTRQFTHSSWLVGAATNLANWVSVSGIPATTLQSRSLGQPHFPLFGEPWLVQLHSFRASCECALTGLAVFAGVRELYRLSGHDPCECDFICPTCGLAHYFDPRPCVAWAHDQTFGKPAFAALKKLARSLESRVASRVSERGVD